MGVLGFLFILSPRSEHRAGSGNADYMAKWMDEWVEHQLESLLGGLSCLCLQMS